MNKRNHEGYFDPTASEALENTTRTAKNKLIFVCSPLRGDYEHNIRRANGFCRFVYTKGGTPLAPHAIMTRFLDDRISHERKAGMEMGLRLLDICDELWAFGTRLTDGMSVEITEARKRGKPICYFNDRCQQIEEADLCSRD